MVRFQEIFNNLVVKTLEQSYQFFSEFIPRLVFAIAIFSIGWICAVIIRKIIAKILKASGFDVVSEKTGLKAFLQKGGYTRNPSSIIGLGFYWLVIFSTLIMVFNALNLEVASQFLEKVSLYMPNIIVALVLLSLGIYISRFLGQFVTATSKLANIPFYEALGKVAGYSVIGLSAMIALEQLDVATTIIAQSFIIIFGVVPLIISIFFIVGGRDIITSIIAGRLIKKDYEKGDLIEIEALKGKIESIDLASTKIIDGNQEIIFPNSEFVKKVVKKQKLE
ncbi:MAG: mechanosensitive ion channel [Candidatus Aceula meridiana]|nr:mechanosensitive ion channel [Candidatus Aceula meridiana]